MYSGNTSLNHEGKHNYEIIHLKRSNHYRHSQEWDLWKVTPIRACLKCNYGHSSGGIRSAYPIDLCYLNFISSKVSAKLSGHPYYVFVLWLNPRQSRNSYSETSIDIRYCSCFYHLPPATVLAQKAFLLKKSHKI